MGESELTERLDAFYEMLRTRTFALKVPDPNPNPEAWKRLQELLQDVVRKWNKAYEIEELIILFLGGDDLVTAFKAHKIEALDNIDKETVEQRDKDFQEAKEDSSKSIAYKSLVEDLHEFWSTNDERLEYFNQITKSTAFFLIGFLASLLLSLVGLWSSHRRSPEHTFEPSFLNLPLLAVVLTSGLFGAGLSMLTGLNARLEAASMPALEKMSLTVNRWARGVVGAGAAFVLFALCMSGLLQGKALPVLTGGSVPVQPIDMANFAHLVVFCILAGFSEKFVPTKLGELEA